MDIVAVIKLLDCGPNPNRRCLAHPGLSVHDPRDGREPDTGERSHVEHRRALV
jgi:hypothetical protein